MQRRSFLQKTTAATASLLLPFTAISLADKTKGKRQENLSFGIVSDAHHGMLPDTNQRLEKFIAEAQRNEVDFIIQLGDFCHKEPKSKAFLNTWQQFKGNKYHVLGNHDMDLSDKKEIMEFWEMPQSYYSFVEKGIRFIVLDANFLYTEGKFIDYAHANFYVDSNLRTYIDEEQIEWFASELSASDLPTVVVSHQSLWHYQWGVKNRLSLQKHMEKHKENIICCLNGHNHIDFHHHQNGIDYFEINSMSYQWIGDSFKKGQYSEEQLSEYKWLEHIAPYQDPLFATVHIEPGKKLLIEGVKSQWVPPSPEEAGIPAQIYGNQYSPIISDYELNLKAGN